MEIPFISPIYSYGVTKLLDKIVKEISKVKHFKTNCHALGELLHAVRPLVLRAEKLSTDSSVGTSGAVVEGSHDRVKKWLEDFRGVLTEAEELLWECKDPAKEVNRRRFSEKLEDITKKIKDICVTQASLTTLAVVLELRPAFAEIRQKISKLEGTLDDLMKQGVETHLAVVQGNEAVAEINQQGVKTHQAVLQLAAGVAEINLKLPAAAAADKLYTSRQVPQQTFGMDNQLKDLQGHLILENKKWIGIYGMGGMGKTLLAKLACNSQDVQNHFQKHIYWLEVGRKQKVGQLLRRLCGKLNVSTDPAEPDDEVKHKLFDALRGKKVLLVVDNVWNDGVPVLDWLDVTSEETGSKMLVTTREIEVLNGRGEQGTTTIKSKLLSESDSLKLFCQHAWGSVEKIPPELDKELVKAVAEECKGHPLALEVIARSQASQKSKGQWERTLTKLEEAEKLNEALEEQLYKKLQLSFDALKSVHPRLQACFLYFAAFPEGSDVHSEELVNLWAGENSFDNEEDGYYLLDELNKRSLIELRGRAEGWPPHGRWYSSRVQLKYGVHDVLRDLGRHLIKNGEVGTMEDCALQDCLFSAGKGLKKFPDKWLTPTQPKIPGGPSPATSRATHISLCHNELESLPTKLQAPRLEVLLLNNNKKRWVQHEIVPLVISPGFLESFSSLKVLDLHQTRIDSLPETLGKLTNLIYLDLSQTGLHQVPVQLEKLTKLKFLSLRDCKVEPWPFDISCLKLLSTLDTTGCSDIWKPQQGFHSLDSLCSLIALRYLSIEGVQADLPSQFSSLVNLCYLEISFRNLKKLTSLPNPEKLKRLRTLILNSCESLEELPRGFTTRQAFPSLEELFMCRFKALQKFPPIEDGAFGKLEILRINDCESLVEFPKGFTSKGAFPTLRELSMSCCKVLQNFPPIEDGAFGKLETLRINNCESLVELPKGFTSKGAFPTLRELLMYRCKALQNFPPIEDEAFGKLETLRLMVVKVW